MRPFPNEPTTATVHDSTVTVSMFEDHLVICPPTRLDLEMTEVLITAAASAVAAGATVMIDLDPNTASDELIARRPLGTAVANCVTGDDAAVGVVGAGLVQLATRDEVWTIDLHQGRVCRSDDAIEPCFLGPDDWTRIHALWVSPTHVNALTSDGRNLSAFAAWTVQRPTERPMSA